MKLFLLALTMLSSTAFAGDKFFCREYKAHGVNAYKMVLSQIGNEQREESKFYPFNLEIYKGSTARPVFKSQVKVTYEDVVVKIYNSNKSIEGVLYLDELDQTWIKIGRDQLRFDCN